MAEKIIRQKIQRLITITVEKPDLDQRLSIS